MAPTAVTVSEPLWLWSPGGGMQVPAGVYDLVALGGQMLQEAGPWRIAVDVWCNSTGVVADQSWAALPPSAVELKTDLPDAISSFLRATELGARRFPECIDWVADVVKVTIPLRGTLSHTLSASDQVFPGLVYLTFGDELNVLEALVHEAAHQYLFLLRAGGPLADPTDMRTYVSPLRPEPRPLGAVLTAYHAIMYMASLYSDIVRAGFLLDGRPERRLATLRTQLASAERTFAAYRGRLTDLGRSVLDASMELAAEHVVTEGTAC
jgi:HEXXH motif-containing protein